MTSEEGPIAQIGPPRPEAPRDETRPRRWPAHILVPVVVIVALGAAVVLSARQVLEPATGVAVRPVVYAGDALPGDVVRTVNVTQVGRGVTVQAAGWLEADPYYIACTALTDGIVEEVLVLEGESVEKGQVVARLVDEDAALDLARAEAELAVAEAAVAVADADVRAARTDWENPVERERAVGVWKAALAETEAELAQLPSLIEIEQAKYERAREELELAKNAQARGGATNIEVIILDKQTDAQQATTEATRRREAILTARRDRLQAEVAAAERNFQLRIEERRALDVAEAAALQARAAQAQAKARRDDMKLQYDRTAIRAPITGSVQSRLKVPGDKIMMAMDQEHSTHVLHLYDPDQLQVRVDVPLADAAHVSVGQACEVVVDILPETVFAGEVSRITHEADIQKNTLQIKVRVLDPSPLLKPEMLTRVKFLPMGGGDPVRSSSSSAPVLRVPAECLVRDDSGTVTVWAIRDRRGRRGRSMAVPVTVEQEQDGWATVRGALQPGDLLAVAGVALSAGQSVRMETEGGTS